MTSDRIGLIASGDLPTALSVVRAARDSSTGVSVAERVRELLAYSISNEYLTLRKRLRWDVDGRRPAPTPQDDIPPLSEREFQELT